jgi:hypothetical protein
MVSYADATNQANCNAVKERPKKANPRISKPIMDASASLKALFDSRQNRDTSPGTMCRKSQNCRLPKQSLIPVFELRVAGDQWHLVDNPTAPAFVRYWGNSGQVRVSGFTS